MCVIYVHMNAHMYVYVDVHAIEMWLSCGCPSHSLIQGLPLNPHQAADVARLASRTLSLLSKHWIGQGLGLGWYVGPPGIYMDSGLDNKHFSS